MMMPFAARATAGDPRNGVEVLLVVASRVFWPMLTFPAAAAVAVAEQDPPGRRGTLL